jgi:mRNA interferase MazF
VINRSRVATLVVCALTSNFNRRTEPGNVLLEPGEANLPKQSVVIVSQVDSVEKTQLGEYVGSLNAQRIAQIFAGMRFQQMSFFARDDAETPMISKPVRVAYCVYQYVHHAPR